MAERIRRSSAPGHIIDFLLLPKVLNVILTHGGTYVNQDIIIGQRGADPSHARVEVGGHHCPLASSTNPEHIHDHGAIPVQWRLAKRVPADVAGAPGWFLLHE